jgi:hypothetical protein
MSNFRYRIVRYADTHETFHVEQKEKSYFRFLEFMFEWKEINTFFSIKECEKYINEQKFKRELPFREILKEY